MKRDITNTNQTGGHNPCFSGNSFAIPIAVFHELEQAEVTILVLVETPLQFVYEL